jgi:hypothetical protein
LFTLLEATVTQQSTITPKGRIIEETIIHRGINARTRARTQQSTMPSGRIIKQMIMDRGIKARSTALREKR